MLEIKDTVMLTHKLWTLGQKLFTEDGGEPKARVLGVRCVTKDFNSMYPVVLTDRGRHRFDFGYETKRSIKTNTKQWDSKERSPQLMGLTNTCIDGRGYRQGCEKVSTQKRTVLGTMGDLSFIPEYTFVY